MVFGNQIRGIQNEELMVFVHKRAAIVLMYLNEFIPIHNIWGVPLLNPTYLRISMNKNCNTVIIFIVNQL